MAVIGRIRKYSGLLIVIVGVALAGFVLQDFFRKSNRTTKEFGEINGNKISYREYDNKVEEQLEQLKKQSEGQPVGSEKVYQMRQQVWNQMVRDLIMSKEYEELGIAVTTDELYELVQGKEPHQYIVQSFTNPQTKQLDRERLTQFLKNYDQLTPEIKTQWINLEKAIKDDRINKKYNALIANAYYTPEVIAKKSYFDKNKKAFLKVIVLPYSDIKDTIVTVTDNDISKAYDEHKQEFEQNEAIRSIDFVVYDVVPSAEDLKKAEEDIIKVKAELEKTDIKDVPNLVNSNSDAKYDSMFFAKGKLPVRIDSAVFKPTPQPDLTKAKKKAKVIEQGTSQAGLIIGPYMENNTYYLARLMDVQSRPDSMKAKHILITYIGSAAATEATKTTKKQAKKTADSLLEVLKKNPADFENLAKKMSADPTAKEKGGDLGWFADGTMVYPFNQACINGKIGDRVVVESQFGYHVIEITGKKEPVKKARVAIIKRVIDPSNKTVQDIYAKASRFSAENQNIQAFKKSAAKLGLNVRNADFVREMDNNLPGLEQAREIVRWAFEEKSKKGDVKDFEVENKYVIAALKNIKEKGIPELENIKKEITAIAKKDKKADMLITKFNDAKKLAPSFDELAAKLICKIDTAKDVTFSSSTLPGTGQELAVIGKIFTLKNASVSEPIKGEKGVFVVNIFNVIEPPVKKDYKQDGMQQASFFKSRVTWEVYNALQKKADIVDNRRFYF